MARSSLLEVRTMRENLTDQVVQAGTSSLEASPQRCQPDKLDDGLLRVIVTRLEIRGKNPFFGMGRYAARRL
jgi:hypothetical protein